MLLELISGLLAFSAGQLYSDITPKKKNHSDGFGPAADKVLTLPYKDQDLSFPWDMAAAVMKAQIGYVCSAEQIFG